jgi:hypothetical protein
MRAGKISGLKCSCARAALSVLFLGYSLHGSTDRDDGLMSTVEMFDGISPRPLTAVDGRRVLPESRRRGEGWGRILVRHLAAADIILKRVVNPLPHKAKRR